ncbi:MAG: methionine--tRNA ligase [Fusobacteria bacterium]|nr:methionine--tRNA ligase [Fusobacteriota bacterium]
MNDKFYVTTAIAYVNGAPHIGFALEVIQADVLARYNRLLGKEVFYLTGVDEHGVKLYETAQKVGVDTQSYVDSNAIKFEKLKEELNLSNSDFIRTTSERHKRGAQKIWTKMFEKGDIYKHSYDGKYCVGCEAYLTEKDLDENGNCLIHMTKPTIIQEENYFFKLSKYSERIKSAILSDDLKIVPESRKNEMLSLSGDGLHDVSFSRPKSALPWGIDVPQDETQVMYVWCDALSNYITALGYEHESKNFQKFWPASAQIIGKDILRFHAGIWPGMLMSAELPLPKKLFVHGFITSNGQKMSKSIGNVINPVEEIEKYGVDAFRYVLIRDTHYGNDGDYTEKSAVMRMNTDLSNDLGNLLNRTLGMMKKYFDSVLPESFESAVIDSDIETLFTQCIERYHQNMNEFQLSKTCENVWEFVSRLNKYIDETAPWTLAKDESKKARLGQVMRVLIEGLEKISILIFPVMPGTTPKILEQLNLLSGKDMESLNFNGIEIFGKIPPGHRVNSAEPIFPRIELEIK